MAALLESELQSIYDVVRDRAGSLDLAHQGNLKIATETLLLKTQAAVAQSREVCLDLAKSLISINESVELNV